jgi:DNA polymerase III delta prime subunit
MDNNQNNFLSSMMSTNMISMMSMRNDISFNQIIFSIFIMNLMAFLPMIKVYVIKYIEKKFLKTKKNIENYLEDKKDKDKDKIITSSIKFTKKDDKNNIDIIFNSLNYYITNNDSANFLIYNNDFSVINREIFKIEENIFCKVNNDINVQDENSNSSYSIELFSYTLKLSELKHFIEDIKNSYLYEQKNKLGHKKFYFNEVIVNLPKDGDGNIMYDRASKNLIFTMTPFYTNKSLTNIFGKHLKDVKERVHLFLNNKEWYNKKGIPYTLGILLHGPPGTGKTSIIKAIAKDTNRHVFNIKLSKNTTQKQLTNLFYTEMVDIVKNGKNETYNIPISERIYVIEDIDCLSDIVYSREIQKDKEKEEIENNIPKSKQEYIPLDLNYGNNISDFIQPQPINGNGLLNDYQKNEIISDIENNKTPKPFKQDKNTSLHGEELNLSFILNLLDGILETPGRILIITTNHPEKLDKAFIRPGRIDINLEVGNCSKDMIIEMFNFFYEKDCSELLKNLNYNNEITPAELNKIVLNNYNNSNNAFKELVEKTK